MKSNNLKLISKNKKKKTIGGAPIWNIAIAGSLIASSLIKIVELILTVVLVPKEGKNKGNYYNRNNYHNNNIFARISKYPSRSTIITGL